MTTSKTIGGGFKAIKSVMRYSARIGPLKLWQAVRSKNACKACAFGTGGQNGGVHNEARKGLEVCNKNIQAHLSDIRPSIPNTVFFENAVADLGEYTGKQLEDLGRLTTPLYKAAGDRCYTPTTYEHALELCITRFSQAQPNNTFFYASGRSSNEAAFLLQLMARLYGTNNINNCSYYCHQASGVALNHTVGTGTATVEYDDIHRCDLMFVFGANPASNHPRFVKALIQLKRRGGKVVVINPAKEAGLVRFASPSDLRSMLKGGERIADIYVQPHLGGDVAFMHGVAKALLESGAQDTAFIQQFTEGFSDYADKVNALLWEDIEKNSGVSKAVILSVADVYSTADKAIFSWSMGLTHHINGVDNIQTLTALALLRGMVGKPGAGLLPLRGHSNIQGTGSMGFTPELKQKVHESLQKALGESLPKQAGLDTMACMKAAHEGNIQAAFFLGGNLLASNPDTKFATQAMNAIPFKCFLNSTLNFSHVAGVDGEVVVLPVRARDEEVQPTTQESMFNFVRFSEGGINRFAQLWSEVSIVQYIGERLIPKSRFDFSVLSSHQAIRGWISKVIPGFKALGEMDASKKEFHIEGRILHQPNFATPTGKAQFGFFPMRERRDDVFLLTSVRSEGQFNSIIYHEYDSYRDQTERWVVLMHPNDIAKKGWVVNQKVDITSRVGCMRAVKVKAFDVREGNAMVYYPEANVLVPTAVDSKSQTPGFKSVEVQLSAS